MMKHRKNIELSYVYFLIINDSTGTPVDLEILDFNLSFARLFNLSARQLNGRKISEVLSNTKYLHLFKSLAFARKKLAVEEKFAIDSSKYRVTAFPPRKENFIFLFKPLSEFETTQEAKDSLTQKWLAFYDLVKQGVFITDAKNHIQHWNRAVEKIAGHKPSEIRNKFCWEIIGHFKTSPKNCLGSLVKKSGHGDIDEIPIGRRLFQMRVDPIYDQRKKFTGALHILTDITERRKIEHALSESKDKYNILVKNINLGVFRTTPTGQILEANPSCFKMFGYLSKKNFIKHPVSDLYFDPADRPVLIKKIRRHGTFSGQEVKLKHKNGRIIFALLFSRAHYDRNGNIDWYDGIIEDITERKKTEQKLLMSEQRFRRIVENSQDAVMLTRPDGVIEYLSPATTRVFGYTPQDLVGKVAKIYHKDDEFAVQKAIGRARRGKSGSNLEYRIITKHGKIKWINQSWAPIKENNRLQMVVSIYQDITERKEAEQEVQNKINQIIQHQAALLKLAKIEITDQLTMIHKIIETDANTLNVERVSYWRTSYDRSSIICEDLYLKSTRQHQQGHILQMKNYPYYFQALEKGRIIAVKDVYNSPDTFEFGDDYFKPNKITSMMDVPVWIHGQLVGIVCHEHIGLPRKWTSDEQSFATSIADLVSLTLESNQRRATLAALRESEAKYRGLINNLNVGIYRTTAHGQIVETNPACASIFGFESVEELKKISVADLYYNIDDRNNNLVLVQKNGFLIDQVTLLKKKDGSSFLGLLNVHVHKNHSGQIDWLDGVIEDITERKQAEQALKQNEERYRTLFESSNDGICVLSTSGIIIAANQRLLDMAGLTRKHIGSHISSYGVFTPSSLSVIQEKMKARLAGQPIQPYELAFHPKKGSDKIIEVTGSLLHDAEGKINGEVVFVRDITERKQSEIALMQAKETAENASKAKTAFLQNVSHELRSPITSIIGYTDLLLDEETAPEKKEMIEIVKNSGAYLLQIINNLLDLSKIEAGIITVKNRKFNIYNTIKNIHQRYLLLAKGKHIDFNIVINKNLPEYIIADQLRIEQIINNLLDNAIKFTSHGKIEFQVQLKKQVLQFSVEDTGIGIAQNRINEIYQQFLKGDYQLSRNYGGAGLGLSIIKQLTDLLNGKVILDSKPGQGTKFLIKIPVQNA